MRSSIVPALLIILVISCAGNGYDVRLKSAGSLISRGSYDAALTELTALIEHYPDAAEPYAMLGYLQYRQNEYEACLESYIIAERRGYGGDFRFYAEKGIALYQTGDYMNAEKELKRSASMRTTPEAQKYLGLIMYRRKQYSSAAAFLEEALKTRSSDTTMLEPLGRALLYTGRISDAAVILNRAAEADPGNVELAFVAATALARDGHFDAALVRYESVPPDHALYSESLYNAGKLAIETGRYDDAVQRLSAFLDRRPGHEDAMVNLASALIATGNFRGAATQTEALIEHDADNVAAQYNHGLALYNLKAYEQAAAHMKFAVSLNPDDIKGRYALALALTEAGNIEEARDQISSLLKMNPTHTGALMWEEYYSPNE